MKTKKQTMSPEYVKTVIARALRVTTGLRAGAPGGDALPPRHPVMALYGFYMPAGD